MKNCKKSAKQAFLRGFLYPALCCLLCLGISSGGDGTQQMLPDASSFLYVGGTGPLNYSTIQEGIDNSLPGGTVFVYAGSYTENIVIDTSVILRGEDVNTTIINGGNEGNIIVASSNHSTIQNFTLRSGGTQFGGVVLNASHITVKDCIISDCLFGGYSEEEGYNMFSECIFIANVNGLLFDGSTRSTIERCTFKENGDGLVLDTDSNYNNITACLFQGNTIGLFLWGLSNFNVISQCQFSGNSIGIRLWDAKKNNFFLNEFTDNENHTESIISDNIWYSLEPLDYTFDGVSRSGFVGNYWDDYDVIDTDGDGIGDVPYEVDADDDDNYPLYKKKEDTGIPGFELRGLLLAGLILVALAKGLKKQCL